MVKITFFITMLLPFIIFMACDNNDGNKNSDKIKSLEEQINAARPITQIILKYRLDGSSIETYNVNSDFSDAYAKDGVLIMVKSTTNYFAVNLDNADIVSVNDHVVEIYY